MSTIDKEWGTSNHSFVHGGLFIEYKVVPHTKPRATAKFRLMGAVHTHAHQC